MPSANEDNEKNTPVLGRHRDTRVRYGFWLEEDTSGSVGTPLPFVDPTATNEDGASVVFLHLAREMSMDEPAAVSVTPTQGGGKIIEDRGQLIKEVTISGTTGYMPLIEGGGGSAVSSSGLPEVTDDAALVRSGYANFIRLRNLFRRYWGIKRYGTPTRAANTRMHFWDVMLDDYWIVVPSVFRLRRASRSPFTFEYTISLQTIAPSFDDKSQVRLLPEDKEVSPALLQIGGITITTPKGVVDALSTVSRATNSIQSATNSVKELDARTTFGGGIPQRLAELNQSIRQLSRITTGFVQNSLAKMIEPFDQLISLLTLPKAVAKDILTLPATLLARVNNSLFGLDDAIGTLQDTVGDFTNENAGWLASLNAVYLESTNLVQSVGARAAVLFGGSEPSDRMRAENNKFIERWGLDAGETGSLPVQPFIQELGLGNTRGDFITQPTGFRESTVLRGDTVFSMAFRELGDPNKFVDIITFNGLVAPFVLDNDGDNINRMSGVLFPGDKFLIPVPSTPSANVVAVDFIDAGLINNRITGTLTAVDVPNRVFTDTTAGWLTNQWVGYSATIGGEARIIVANDMTTFTVNRAYTVPPVATNPYSLELIVFRVNHPITPVEAVYGRDILASFAFGASGTEDSVNVVFGANGDFATITGIENYIQSIRLLMATEQGRNMLHPLYGIPYQIGVRPSVNLLSFSKLLIKRALLADPRTSEVLRVDLQNSFDILATVIEVRPVGVNSNTAVVQLAS